MRIRRATALVALTAVLAVGCGSDDPTPQASPSPTVDSGQADAQITVANASFDLAVGEGQRVIMGLLTADNELIAFGDVQVKLFYLGEQDASGSQEPLGTTTASFLPVPGMEPASSGDTPTVLSGEAGAGVYAASIDFDRPGFYGLLVTATLADGTTVAGTGSIRVNAEPQVPAVGDEAPSVRQATLGEEDFEFTLAEIDSRATNTGRIPDRELHDRTIADILDAGEPFVVVISTPLFCQSRFCGPITDEVQALAGEYGDRAEFVHLEVWENFEAQKLNGSAAKWIQTPDGGGGEPWTFFVDADGIIQARWDNVLDIAELRGLLEALPPLG